MKVTPGAVATVGGAALVARRGTCGRAAGARAVTLVARRGICGRAASARVVAQRGIVATSLTSTAERREPTAQELREAAGSYIQVGVDVAAGGDDETAACARVNGIVVARASWQEPDPRGKLVAWLQEPPPDAVAAGPRGDRHRGSWVRHGSARGGLRLPGIRI